MKQKLLWFFQPTDEEVPVDYNKPGPSRAMAMSKTPTEQQQRPKRLFITDGWSCPFTGVCIYILRINIIKQLPEEGFQKDLFCGIVDAERVGLVASIERIVEYVYMQALAYPNIENEEDEMNCALIKQQLLPGLRSFCSALRVCEQVCNNFNVFEDNKTLFAKNDGMEEVKEMVQNPEFVSEIEERVGNWIKGIAKVRSNLIKILLLVLIIFFL